MRKELKELIKQRIPLASKVAHTIRLYQEKVNEDRGLPRFRKTSSGISVFYVTDNIPNRPASRKEKTGGGMVKMTLLAEQFPHSYPKANIVYTVSSVAFSLASKVCSRAKQKNIKVIVNQNGVAYPAWKSSGWENINQLLKATIDQADFIIYQSKFCQLGAQEFLTPPNVPNQVVYNPVDINLFRPVSVSSKPKELTILLGGTQNERYRVELALQSFRYILAENPNARLLIAGNLWKPEADAIGWTRSYLETYNLNDKVTFTGPYSQAEAPQLFDRAHILLHTQFNDASPTLILESMASGVPVVYINSGGTPEMVEKAGIGIEVEQSWQHINLPDPKLMSGAVLEIMSQYHDYSTIGRERAASLYSLEIFIDKHRQIFENVLEL